MWQCRVALLSCRRDDRVCSTSGRVTGWGGRICWTIPSCKRRQQRRCGGRQLWPTPSRPPQTAGLGRARAAPSQVWPSSSAHQSVCISRRCSEHRVSGTMLLCAFKPLCLLTKATDSLDRTSAKLTSSELNSCLYPGAVLAAAPVCATPMIKGAHGHHRPVVASVASGRAEQQLRSDDAARGVASPSGARRPMMETQVPAAAERRTRLSPHSHLLQCSASRPCTVQTCRRSTPALLKSFHEWAAWRQFVSEANLLCVISVLRCVDAGADRSRQVAAGARQDADTAAHGGCRCDSAAGIAVGPQVPKPWTALTCM